MRRRKQARREHECLRSKLGALMRDYESMGAAFRRGTLVLGSGVLCDSKTGKQHVTPLGGDELVALLQQYSQAKAELDDATAEFERLDAC